MKTVKRSIKKAEWGHMSKNILQLALEIIYLLTGEDYGPIKKKSNGPPPLYMTAEGPNNKKIVEVTQKMMELLTGEVPIRCQDVTVYVSMQEWEYLEGHKELYKDVMMVNQPTLTSPDLPSATKTEEDEAPMLKDPNDNQTLKLPEPNGESNVVSDSMVHEDKELLHNRSCRQPAPTLYLSNNIKEEPSDDDDFIITKFLISTEEECSFDTGQKEAVVHERPARHERPNGGLQPSKPLNGSYNNDFPLRIPKTEKTFECRQCGKCFPSDLELSQHQLIHMQSQTFICSFCGKCFFTELDFGDHMKNHVNAQNSYDVPFDPNSVLFSRLTQKDQFRCHYCGENFIGKFELATHQLVHFKNPYPCTECGRNFQNKSGLVTHQKTHSKHFDCPTCGKSFLSRATLLLHQEVHLNIKPDLSREPESIFDGDSDIIVRQIDALFSCTECGDVFDSRDGFLQHRKNHLKANPYICSECGKLFKWKSSLSLHRRLIHQGNVSFSCPDCGKGFSCHSELTRHIRVHTGEQPYLCKECGKCFSFKSALVRHQRMHSGNRPYVCSACGKGFSCNSALQRHHSIHLKESIMF